MTSNRHSVRLKYDQRSVLDTVKDKMLGRTRRLVTTHIAENTSVLLITDTVVRRQQKALRKPAVCEGSTMQLSRTGPGLLSTYGSRRHRNRKTSSSFNQKDGFKLTETWKPLIGSVAIKSVSVHRTTCVCHSLEFIWLC